MEYGDARGDKLLMPLECIIDQGKETRELSRKMIGDKLIMSTSNFMPQTNPLPRQQILKGAMVRKELDKTK